MITTVVNSLVNHVYALLSMLVGWLTSAPTPLADGIAGAVALVLLCGALIWATSGDLGSHRRTVKLALTDNAKLSTPKRRHTPRAIARRPLDDQPTQPVSRSLALQITVVPADDRVIAFVPLDAEQGGVHVGAHEDWHPAEDVAAVDTPDAEWLAYLAGARRERVELLDGIAWTPLDWTAVNEAMAPAEAWHDEHGRHCACCHVEGAVIWAEWRTGENTIAISHQQLVAAGVRPA